MADIKCPEISQQLINYLRAVFRDRCVDPRHDDPAIAYGQATVVRHLEAVKQTQEEDAYVSTQSEDPAAP